MALSILYPSDVYAITNYNIESLSKLSLYELVNIDVSVASYKEEPITLTPSIVSKFESEDLKAIGLHSVKDFLSFVPGVIVHNAVFSSSVSIRGIFEATNQKILFLLDGVPYFMPSHSDIPLLGIPLEAISHIEVIRGPGAIYHGTNASAGVINIVTKTRESNLATFRYGSNALINSSGHWKEKVSDHLQFSAAYEYQQMDAFNVAHKGSNRNPFTGVSGDGNIKQAESMKSFLGQFNHNSLDVVLHTFESEYDSIAGIAALDNLSIYEQAGHLIHANYSWEYDHTQIKTYADYNNYYLNLPIENHAADIELDGDGNPMIVAVHDGGFRMPNHSDNRRTRAGLTMNNHLGDRFSLFSLVEIEKRESASYEGFNANSGQSTSTVFSGENVLEKTLASQLEYRSDTFTLFAGGRYVDNEYAGSKFNPRISAVFSPSEKHSFKLLYGTGFNSPNFLQQFVNAPGLVVGSEDLKAESIRSTDISYSYFSKNWFVETIFFQLQARDFIERAPASEGGVMFENRGKFSRSGIEANMQYTLDKTKIFANFHYTREANETDDLDDIAAVFVPKVNASFGAHHTITSQQRIGASLRTVGARNKLSAYYLLNLSHEIELGKLHIQTTIKNALNDRAEQPDVVNLRTHATLVSEDQRGAEIALKYLF